MGLKVLDKAKESNSELEHTAMAVEHNIRVKKMLREAASDHPNLFSIGVLKG